MRRSLVPALILVAVIAAALVYIVWPRTPTRTGSVPVDGADVRLRRDPPKTYSVVYRVETYEDDETISSTEELVVRRPFEARLETSRDGERIDLTVNTFSRLQTSTGVFAVPPAPPALDLRPDAFIETGIREGFVQAREVRRVARRLCRVYRTQGPASGPLERVDDDPKEYAERCIDADGIVLEDIDASDGEIARRRIAQRVSIRPSIDEDAFEVEDPTIPVDRGGGSVQRLAKGSKPPGDFFEAEDGPKGFDYEGRYAVVPPQATFADPLQRNRIVAFTSDVWTRGIDVVVVEQGASLGGEPPFAEADDGVDIDLGEIGEGQIVFNPAAVEVRALVESGAFVRVFGTLPPDELVRVARSLQKVEGGTIVVDD